MEFDSADLASMEANGTLYSVILHEMGHVLGVGTLWSSKGLLSGAGTSNPQFTGAQAAAAYNQIFGTIANGVPVESGGGSGTRDAHFSESLFRTELMTGYVGPGTVMPLSQITVGSLADIGYTVNYAGADPYSRSGSASNLTTSQVATAGGSLRPEVFATVTTPASLASMASDTSGRPFTHWQPPLGQEATSRQWLAQPTFETERQGAPAEATAHTDRDGVSRHRHGRSNRSNDWASAVDQIFGYELNWELELV